MFNYICVLADDFIVMSLSVLRHILWNTPMAKT